MAKHFTNREQTIVDKADVWLKLEGLPQYGKLHELAHGFIKAEHDRFLFWSSMDIDEHKHVHYPDYKDANTCYFCQLVKLLDIK